MHCTAEELDHLHQGDGFTPKRKRIRHHHQAWSPAHRTRTRTQILEDWHFQVAAESATCRLSNPDLFSASPTGPIRHADLTLSTRALSGCHAANKTKIPPSPSASSS
jgi:hypothetical protein